MDYAEINAILSDLRVIRSDSKKYKRVSTEVIKKINDDYGEQGEEGQTFEVYSTPVEGLFC